MKRVIAMSLICFVSSAAANDVCSLLAASADKKLKINGVPGYFFKVHPDGTYLSFIEHDHNTLLDLNSGKEFPMPGKVDPVWSPDGKFLTHPNDDDYEKGLKFYHGDDVMNAVKAGTHGRLIPFDSGIKGVYQSIGKVDKTYKIITDSEGLSLGNYDYTKNGPRLIGNIGKPCANVKDFKTDIPMISKDGKYLSTYDDSSQSTKIYKLNGLECELALDLGFPTGKISFNYDSSQIAFHIDQFSTFDDGYFSGVSQDKIKNVVVLNLDQPPTGKLVPSSWALASQNTRPGDGGYYPDFDKNGVIYFMEDIDNHFQIVQVSPKSLEFRQIEENVLFDKLNCANCNTLKSAPNPSIVLSQMWMTVCAKKNPIALRDHSELVMSIDPVECQKMVKEFWVPSLGVELDKLLKACPQKAPHSPKVIGHWRPEDSSKAEAIIKGKCIICHTAPKEFLAEESMTVYTGPSQTEKRKMTYLKKVPAINLDDLDLKVYYKMFSAIQDNKMPKGNPLKAAEKRLVLDYLQRRKLDMDSRPVYEFTSYNEYTEENLEVLRKEMIPVDASPEQKRNIILMINCDYGRKNCPEYLESYRPSIEEAANSLPENMRAQYIEREFLRLRCENLFEVTPQQCVDYQESVKIKLNAKDLKSDRLD